MLCWQIDFKTALIEKQYMFCAAKTLSILLFAVIRAKKANLFRKK